MCVHSWSRDGHKLVSASTDNIVSQWDVLTGDCDQRFRFPSPILKLQYHPRDMWVRRHLLPLLSVVLALMTFLLCRKGQGVGVSHEISPGPADSLRLQTCCLACGRRFGPECGRSFWQAGGVHLHWQRQGKSESTLCLVTATDAYWVWFQWELFYLMTRERLERPEGVCEILLSKIIYLELFT